MTLKKAFDEGFTEFNHVTIDEPSKKHTIPTQYMYFFAKYNEPHKDLEELDKIKRLYNNYESCKKANQETNTAHQNKHTKPHRIWIRNAKSNECKNGKTRI